MKKLKVLALTLIAALLINILPMTVFATGNNVKVQPVDTNFVFDGNKVKPPVGQFSFTYKNTTYVPLRFVSYSLQKNVKWDGKIKKVTVSDPTANQLVSIKESIMNSQGIKGTSIPSNRISVSPINVSFEFNRVKKSLPANQFSFIYKGTLYVPIRFVAESTGSIINWSKATKTITGKSKAYVDKTETTTENNKPVLQPPTSTETVPSGGQGSNTGSGSDKLSYETITNSAQAKLESLQAESKSVLLNLAKEYLSATSDETKKKLLADGQKKLNGFTAQFENIVQVTESQLKENGYSTEIISQYRKTFNDEIEAGKQLAGGLL